jgi:hypothetical protein
MSLAQPALYSDIVQQIQPELLKYQEAADITNLFNPIDVDDVTLETLAFRYLDQVGRASLSKALWDPTKVKHDLKILAMNRYSCGIQKDLPFQDWKVLLKMPNVEDSNLASISMQPSVQAGHYLIQGTQLMDDNTRGAKPADDQYNFFADVGANVLNSTITRPIGVGQVTGSPNTWTESAGAWATYANMNTDLSKGVGQLGSKGFSVPDTLCFYPQTAFEAMTKKRSSSGDGMRNAFMELNDMGISNDRIIPLNDIYMYTRAGKNPTNALFDLWFVDRSAVKIFRTMKPFTNVFIDNSGTMFPEMHIEAGQTFMPLFIPKYHAADAKWYKGVNCIRGIIGT